MSDFTRPTFVSGQSSGTVMLMLALNLIILAFFILLNGMAMDTEAKAKAAYDSLKEGFSSNEKGAGLGDADTDELLKPWQLGLNPLLQGVIHNALQISTPDIKVDADQILLTVPLKVLFDDNSADLLPSGHALVANLASITKDKEGLPVFRMVITIGMQAKDSVLASQRTMAIYGALNQAEAEKGEMSAAMRVSEQEVLVIALSPLSGDYRSASSKMGQIDEQARKFDVDVKAVGAPQGGGR